MAEEQLEMTTLPQNIEAEKYVLGSILIDNESLYEALEYIEAEDFYLRKHQAIFRAMCELKEAGELIDILHLSDRLSQNTKGEQVDESYLTELAISTPSSTNIAHYAQLVEDKSIRRNIIQETGLIVQRAYDQKLALSDLIDEAATRMMGVAEQRDHQAMKRLSHVLENVENQVLSLSNTDGSVTGLATGYTDLDRLTTGFHEDELIILAARPGVGKTAFALNIVQNVASHRDKTVALFSLEMSAESLVTRMLAARGMIENYHLRSGQLQDEEWESFAACIEDMRHMNVFIDDTAGIKISEIRAKCKRILQEQGQIDLVVIDYLQLIEASGKESRQQEVSYISRQLKKLAKELHVPVLALSQLSRGVEQRNDKRPLLSDLRESGAIEQDADIVAFLYRKDYNERPGEDEEEEQGWSSQNLEDNLVEVIIEKNRSGSRGSVKLAFRKEYGKFTSVSLREDV